MSFQQQQQLLKYLWLFVTSPLKENMHFKIKVFGKRNEKKKSPRFKRYIYGQFALTKLKMGNFCHEHLSSGCIYRHSALPPHKNQNDQ